MPKYRVTINSKPGCMVGLQCTYIDKPTAQEKLLQFIEQHQCWQIGRGVKIAPVTDCPDAVPGCGYLQATLKRW